ncbi:hypothetical protein B0J12DRAFT_603931 [Macrophomina phaseolina]|uniref:C2H2-type domain-containing protein n=1 Tax=Macrophomina phaseolina TaxID=35725 RepID=A0ABQ8G4P4_9PEZI|nr:hypothetical protein B0J12DRAFT_603931 [Macrophomina phaseolina]
MKLLGWVVCSKRPLKWHEIQGAFSIDPETDDFNPDGRLMDHPKDLCASLVEKRPDQSLDLVHSTAKKYLIKEKCVKPSEVERDLATLCLGYLNLHFLTLPALDDNDDEIVEGALLDGFYALLDYAVVCWVFHVEESISKPDDKDRLCELSELLDMFLENHWLKVTANLTISTKIHGKLEPFKSEDFYDRLAQAFVFAKKQKGPYGKAPSDNDVLDLHRVVAGVRVILERLASSSDQNGHKDKLTELYGSRWFKCPRMNCQYFDKGFKTPEERDEHIARHERAFACPFEGCPYTDVGFPTSKELDRHLSAVHHLDVAGELEFPDTPKPQKKQEGHIPCPQCGEKFTRKYNMVSHMQKHTGTKNIKCDQCDRSFYKSSDLERHKRTHQTLRQPYVPPRVADHSMDPPCAYLPGHAMVELREPPH